MCEFYDTSVSRSCREPVADEVQNKEKANFCGYFKPIAGAFEARDNAAADEAKAKLAALFGDENAVEKDAGHKPLSEEDKAREELNRLFGIDEKKKD